MDIKTFVNAAASLPADISILAKGPTGIGKSHIFHDLGARLNLPVIDRRLSQMTEGDIIVAEGLKKVRPRGKIKPIKK